MLKPTLAFVAGTLVGVAATIAVSPATLVVNGKETKNGAIVVDGVSYASVKALEDGGAQVSSSANRVTVNFAPLGGRNQVDAIEGAVGEWIQNDGWRIRVESVDSTSNPFGKGPGYALKVEMRNLSKKPMSPFASGMDKLQILDKDGNIVAFSQNKFREYFGEVAPGGGFTTTIEFGDPANKLAALAQPEKLLIFFRKTGGSKLKDFRVLLKSD